MSYCTKSWIAGFQEMRYTPVPAGANVSPNDTCWGVGIGLRHVLVVERAADQAQFWVFLDDKDASRLATQLVLRLPPAKQRAIARRLARSVESRTRRAAPRTPRRRGAEPSA